MNYQFPATIFTRNSIWRQWWHLFSEVVEVGMALVFGSSHQVAKEIFDVKHSAETLHRIIEREGVDISLAKDSVERGNRARNYYVKG